MSQENYIELGELLKTLEQQLLKSSLKVQSAELELKVVVNQENDDLRIYILDSGIEADWKNLHTLKVKVFQDTGNPPGGSGTKRKPGSEAVPSQAKIDTDQDPGSKAGGSGHSPVHANPPQGPGTSPGGSGG